MRPLRRSMHFVFVKINLCGEIRNNGLCFVTVLMRHEHERILLSLERPIAIVVIVKLYLSRIAALIPGSYKRVLRNDVFYALVVENRCARRF